MGTLRKTYGGLVFLSRKPLFLPEQYPYSGPRAGRPAGMGKHRCGEELPR